MDLSLPLLYMGLTAALVLAGQAIGSVWGGAIHLSCLPKYSTVSTTSLRRYSVLPGSPPNLQIREMQEMLMILYVRHRISLLVLFQPVLYQVRGATSFTGNVVDLCPGLQNLILDSARSATSYNGLPRNHSKNDNPSWSYVGRSYGVGSSTGVALRPDSFDNLLSYSYYETGYDVESSCAYNSTSAFNLSLVYKKFQPANRSNVELNIFVASGFLPNSDLDSGFITFPIVQTNRTSDGLLTWAASSSDSLNYTSIAAAGPSYDSFDTIQCLIDFVLTNFSVTVNVTSSTIEVLPLHSISTESFDDCKFLLSSCCFPISDYREISNASRIPVLASISS